MALIINVWVYVSGGSPRRKRNEGQLTLAELGAVRRSPSGVCTGSPDDFALVGLTELVAEAGVPSDVCGAAADADLGVGVTGHVLCGFSAIRIVAFAEACFRKHAKK
jgi:hypothetical protein